MLKILAKIKKLIPQSTHEFSTIKIIIIINRNMNRIGFGFYSILCFKRYHMIYDTRTK